MKIAVLSPSPPENRTFLTPSGVAALLHQGHQIFVECGAGTAAGIPDEEFAKAGAILNSRNQMVEESEIVLSIQTPTDLPLLTLNKHFITISNPLFYQAETSKLSKSPSAFYSLDLLPRTTLAQAMDVLSSQATLAGYQAVLEASYHYSRPFPMLNTAAGTNLPARVVVLGAGVAGLQAIATAKRLGARVWAYDVRKAAQEEVRSLGAEFIEIEGAIEDPLSGGYALEQTEAYKSLVQASLIKYLSNSDVVICTANIPGKKAPILLDYPLLNAMKSGAIVIDLAVEQGGNCPESKANQTVVYNGITIIGDSFLARKIPLAASEMLNKNALAFLKTFSQNPTSELIQACCFKTQEDTLTVNSTK